MTTEMMETGELLSTADVAEETDVSESEAREWAADNGVQLFGNAYAWTAQDVSDFLADLDDDDDAEDDDDEFE